MINCLNGLPHTYRISPKRSGHDLVRVLIAFKQEALFTHFTSPTLLSTMFAIFTILAGFAGRFTIAGGIGLMAGIDKE